MTEHIWRDGSEVTDHTVTEDQSFVYGGSGEPTSTIIDQIERAQQRIRFAYFALSDGSRVTAALASAAERGVDVAGVVDADQAFLHWNGVPTLRGAGADVRYYPGLLTGAPGRMHHKVVAVDRRTACLTTANASVAADDSMELSFALHSPQMCTSTDREIVRLGQASRREPNLRPL